MNKENFWALIGYLTVVLFHIALAFFWTTAPDKIKLFLTIMALPYALTFIYSFVLVLKSQTYASGKQLAMGLMFMGISTLKYLLPVLGIYALASLINFSPVSLRNFVIMLSAIAIGLVLSMFAGGLVPPTLVSLYFIIRGR